MKTFKFFFIIGLTFVLTAVSVAVIELLTASSAIRIPLHQAHARVHLDNQHYLGISVQIPQDFLGQPDQVHSMRSRTRTTVETEATVSAGHLVGQHGHT